MQEIKLDDINNLLNIDESISKKIDYKINYKKELNTMQYKGVFFQNGFCLVVAGAGTGKTRVLTYRCARLVEDGVSPSNILILTFTKKAAKEMMKRSSDLLDDRCKKINGGTYHSFCANLLRGYGQNIGIERNFTILDIEDSKDTIDIVRSALKLDDKERQTLFPNKSFLQSLFSKAIDTSTSLEDLIKNEYSYLLDDLSDILLCYDEYQKFKKQKNMLDFNDLILKCCELLENCDEVAIQISKKFKYIMVDEYQDSNLLQVRFLKLISKINENLMVVGDPMQSIYRFRGANFENIMNFQKEFKNSEIILLSENYRSSQPILDISNSIMNNAKEKIYNPLVTTTNTSTIKPSFVQVSEDYKQSLFVAQEIMNLKKKYSNLKLDDICILARNASIFNGLEMILNKCKIPYVKYGGLKFLEKSHIKDVLSIMKVLENQSDIISWIRMLRFSQGIGVKTANKIANEVISTNSYYALIKKPFNKTKYANYLNTVWELFYNSLDKGFHTQIENIINFYYQEGLKNYEDFDKRKEDIEFLKNMTNDYNNMTDFLTDILLEPTDVQTLDSDNNKEKEHITLSTIHSSKGLEWKVGFIIHALDGIIPSNKSFENEKELEEERRIFYVATTRIKELLYFISPTLVNNFGNFIQLEPSRFLTESNNIKKYTNSFFIK